jgi:hypothetical protein
LEAHLWLPSLALHCFWYLWASINQQTELETHLWLPSWHPIASDIWEQVWTIIVSGCILRTWQQYQLVSILFCVDCRYEVEIFIRGF